MSCLRIRLTRFKKFFAERFELFDVWTAELFVELADVCDKLDVFIAGVFVGEINVIPTNLPRMLNH